MASMKEVADAAGVSVSTVSRVLNGKYNVNSETRRRVMEVLEQMNFHPNVLAKSLKLGRSHTICLLVPAIENQIFAQITRGLEDTARKSGFSVVLCNTDEDAMVERACIEKMKNYWIDGFAICAAVNSDADYVRQLRADGFPTALVCRYGEQDVGVMDIVSVDNYQAAYDGTQYLIRTGHRRIALAAGQEELFLYRERYRGYRAALADAGIAFDERLVMRENSGTEGFYQATRQVMGLPEPPDAIFATSDPKAFVVMHALHDMGRRIPQDVAVLGFDNVTLSANMEPPLSTVGQPLYEMGCAAAKMLLQQIDYKNKNGALPPPVQHVMGVELIIRRSTY